MKRPIIIVAVVLVLFGLWYAFRPERLFIATTVNETFPGTANASTMNAAKPALVAEGNFHDGAHKTTGTAAIYKLADGKKVLRFSQFETSNGPDVHVYLVAASDATDSDTVKNAGFLELGSIKGSKGDQNYDLPADADLNKYRAVTIWCARFGVNFGTAPLKMEGMNSMAMASNSPSVLSEGNFHDGAHKTSGVATIYQLNDGKRVLRLSNFETSNGPDVRVLLVASKDATDSDTVKNAEYIELGSLKGTQGDQNYEIKSDLDLAKYHAVTIWCNRFKVNFGTAPLATKQS